MRHFRSAKAAIGSAAATAGTDRRWLRAGGLSAPREPAAQAMPSPDSTPEPKRSSESVMRKVWLVSFAALAAAALLVAQREPLAPPR
ncbi:MAG: hypothetical protein NZR01_02510, partial [Bryobacteraceae bacterium]|nr:hypothetical protein [Bryobacteraceae bacterium]